MLHLNICTFALYVKYVAPPTNSISWMAAKTLEQEQQLTVRWQRTRRHACLEIIVTQNRSDWRRFSMQLPCLPSNRGKGSIYGWSTLAMCLPISIMLQKLRSRFLCRGMIPPSIPKTEKQLSPWPTN